MKCLTTCTLLPSFDPSFRHHLIVVEDDDEATEEGPQVQLTAPHHKNDRRGFDAIEVTYPRGLLGRLFEVHLREGHKLLKGKKEQPMLFVSGYGLQYNDSTFSQAWAQIIARRSSFKHFPASAARSTFVEAYTGAFGMSPTHWEGAATVMGNSTRQWRVSYAPRLRQREAQVAVDAHHTFRSRLQQRGTGDEINQ